VKTVQLVCNTCNMIWNYLITTVVLFLTFMLKGNAKCRLQISENKDTFFSHPYSWTKWIFFPECQELLIAFSLFVCFVRTGVWTQDFVLAKQEFNHLSHNSSPFCSGYFRDGVSRTICPGWPWTKALLISAS
jgi:hypothetical protein